MNDSGTLVTLANAFNSSIVNSLATLAIAIAMATFFYGGFRYVWGIRNGDEQKLKEGNKFLVWGGVALFVMVSMWGIISVLQGTFGFTSMSIKIPNANLNFIGSSAGGGAGGGGGSQLTSSALQPKQAASGSGTPKAKDAGGVCEPDADGTTYHVDPSNSSQCLPDSSCQPGYKEDPSDSTQCVQMSNDEACPAENGVTFTFQSNGTCTPNNGGCPSGMHSISATECEQDSDSAGSSATCDGIANETRRSECYAGESSGDAGYDDAGAGDGSVELDGDDGDWLDAGEDEVDGLPTEDDSE